MMQQIIIPLEAIKDAEAFRTWYIAMRQKLFYMENKQEIITKFKLIGEKLEQVKVIEEIMRYVNLVYHDDFSLIPYRNKNRKLNCKYADILGIAVHVIKKYYQITVAELGKLLNMNHSTVSYHILKHARLIPFEPEHTKNYFKLLIILEHEKIIPIVERDGINPKWVLPNGLSK